MSLEYEPASEPLHKYLEQSDGPCLDIVGSLKLLPDRAHPIVTLKPKP